MVVSVFWLVFANYCVLGVDAIWLALGLAFNDWCLVILLFKVC